MNKAGTLNFTRYIPNYILNFNPTCFLGCYIDRHIIDKHLAKNDPLPEGVGRCHVEMLKARFLTSEEIRTVQERLWSNLGHT